MNRGTLITEGGFDCRTKRWSTQLKGPRTSILRRLNQTLAKPACSGKHLNRSWTTHIYSRIRSSCLVKPRRSNEQSNASKHYTRDGNVGQETRMSPGNDEQR